MSYAFEFHSIWPSFVRFIYLFNYLLMHIIQLGWKICVGLYFLPPHSNIRKIDQCDQFPSDILKVWINELDCSTVAFKIINSI